MMGAMSIPVDDQIAELWDFSDPAASQARFREAEVRAMKVGDEGRRMALLTQHARAMGLQKRFDDAHVLLDDVEQSLSDLDEEHRGRVRVRLLLERGRVLNSSGKREQARPVFEQAWREAVSIQLDALAVDAAHMVAIASGAGNEAIEWNHRAIELADSSSDPRARRWRGSLHNNLGWTHHDRGDYESAMQHFEQALAARLEQNQPREARIARWCVGRCLRSMNRIDEALAQQMQLRDELQRAGEKDGFVHEEIAECLHALGRSDEAGPHFAVAHEQLKDDPWIEPARLARLAELSQR